LRLNVNDVLDDLKELYIYDTIRMKKDGEEKERDSFFFVIKIN